MNEIVGVVLFLGVYIVLMRFVLPKFGIST